MSERILCPFCSSPDTVPYDFGTDTTGVIYKQLYPRAGRCMDCEQVFYDHERQRQRLDLASLKR